MASYPSGPGCLLPALQAAGEPPPLTPSGRGEALSPHPQFNKQSTLHCNMSAMSQRTVSSLRDTVSQCLTQHLAHSRCCHLKRFLSIKGSSTLSILQWLPEGSLLTYHLLSLPLGWVDRLGLLTIRIHIPSIHTSTPLAKVHKTQAFSPQFNMQNPAAWKYLCLVYHCVPKAKHRARHRLRRIFMKRRKKRY